MEWFYSSCHLLFISLFKPKTPLIFDSLASHPSPLISLNLNHSSSRPLVITAIRVLGFCLLRFLVLLVLRAWLSMVVSSNLWNWSPPPSSSCSALRFLLFLFHFAFFLSYSQVCFVFPLKVSPFRLLSIFHEMCVVPLIKFDFFYVWNFHCLAHYMAYFIFSMFFTIMAD